MSFVQGTRQVGPQPTLIFDPAAPGQILLQSLGTASPATLVYVGGSAVAAAGAAAGVILPPALSATQPGAITPFPAVHVGDSDAPTDAIFAVTGGGTVSVAFIAPV